MAYSESPFSSTSSSYRHRWNYDVFLSFRGEDTRKQFTDHLYSALIQAGIHTFRGDNELPRGEEISPQLLRAIEGSRISVVVFSTNYASSRWCLDELVKIIECRQKTPHVVIPIFYHTDPSDVRKQTGSYAKAFDEHEKIFKGEMEKVNRWREALTQAANLSGYGLNDTNGYEAEFIKRVVSDVACKLGNKTLHVAKHLVGISSKNMVRRWIEPVEEHDVENSGRLLQPGARATSFRIIEDNPSESRGAPLLTGSTKLVGRAFEENRNVIWSWLMDDEVSTIGIYGMGGAGKTTMLKHIYNELLQSSDISHHVYWVTVSRDFSVPKLQNKIAKRIQLSFSNEEEELEYRAAELSRELMEMQRWILILDDLWESFDIHKVGIPTPLKGCKLIMTTRSETVCLQMNSKKNVRVNPLSNEEAWTLFMEVLGHDRQLSPKAEQVARDITRECAGLPLGIKTIAGTMKGVDGMHEWSDALEDLKQSKVPQDKVEEEVFRILRFSYTHLSDEALRQCFLYCGLFPEDFEIRRENLIDYLINEGVVKRQKSREAEINKGHTMLDKLERACLLETLGGGDYVKMHDLIRDMAIQILEENSRAIVKAGAQLKELPDAKEWSEKLESDDGRIQVGVHGLEQGAEEELICLHHEAQSGMENTCAEYIQHVDINDSLEQTRLMESDSGKLVQPDTSASSTKLVGRASEKNVIWSWLMDDKVSIIGIYGMGGNGKTTILRNICNELLERQDISYSIYWVNVPQDFRIDTSQDLIAKRLDLNLSSKDDDLCRVVELEKELMMKQKWILILNDLWNSFDPQELGIPIPLNGSKFIMTTRLEMVCQQMNCQNSIRVDRLSDEEALTLFMEKLGHDRQLSQEEQQIAKEAARECDGLPLGIVTLAESLKGVDDLHKWKITLKRLKESNFWDMEDQIFKTLRLSYDCLDDSAKQCFVYCALFDESHKIERGELIESFIEEGIINEMSRPAAFDKSHSILDSLENVCLLERIDDGKAVKMHDLLRDMAIQILDDEYSLDMV